MNKLLIIFISSLLAFPCDSLIQPQNLVDDAREQLDQLRSIVLGDIMVAHDNLNDELFHFETYSVDSAMSAAMEMKEHNLVVNNEIDTIFNLAEAAGYDVTTCTPSREENLDNLRLHYVGEIRDCQENADKQAARITDDAKYLVDILANTVDHFEAQLRRCGEQLTCISSLLTKIELNKIRMPQNIETEVQAVENILTTMKASTKSCVDSNAAAYITQSNIIFEEIQACVNRILG